MPAKDDDQHVSKLLPKESRLPNSLHNRPDLHVEVSETQRWYLPYKVFQFNHIFYQSYRAILNWPFLDWTSPSSSFNLTTYVWPIISFHTKLTITTLLRLDFNVLTIAPPATSGLCSSTDYFHVHSKAFSPTHMRTVCTPHTSSNI